MSKRNLPDSVYLEVHRLRKQEFKTYAQIAELTGVSASYCCEIVRRELYSTPQYRPASTKPKTPKTQRLTPEQVADVKERIRRGESYQSIADLHGVPYQTVVNYHRKVDTKCQPGEDVHSWYERTAYLHPWVQLGGIPRVGNPVYADPIYYEV